ncbi:hypothetical protein HDU86_007899 [Geranomyces michiganensis]|nr:hypothetical protein HDU86_007899 [Geranomyces michiganensis]
MRFTPLPSPPPPPPTQYVDHQPLQSLTLLTPAYLARLAHALRLQVDTDPNERSHNYHPATSASASAIVWRDLSATISLLDHNVNDAFSSSSPPQVITSVVRLPPGDRRSVYSALLDACLNTDTALNANDNSEQLLSAASSALLTTLGQAWGLIGKSQNLLLFSALFDRHCRSAAHNPLASVFVAFERVRPALVSTGWMTPAERTALLELLAAVAAHCRLHVATYRTAFPCNKPKGELEANLRLLRAVLREPFYRQARVDNQLMGQQTIPSVRIEMRALLEDAARARYRALCAASFALSGFEDDADRVAEGALALVRSMLADIVEDARWFQRGFLVELQLAQLTAEVYFEQLAQTLRSVEPGASQLARLLALVDHMRSTRAWRGWGWIDENGVREVYEACSAQYNAPAPVGEPEAITSASPPPSVAHDHVETGSDVFDGGLRPAPSPLRRRKGTPPPSSIDPPEYLPSPPNETVRHMPDVDLEELARGVKSVIRFKCYTLQTFDMTLLNHQEFHALQAFFTAPYQPRRGNSRPRNEQTIAKGRERVCGFLGWLKQSGRFRTPSFVHYEDVDLFMDKYINGYLRSIRGLGHGTIANHITAAIDVLKYRSSEVASAASLNPKANPKIARLMFARNQEQVLADRERNGMKETASAGIVWEQFLEAVRCQRSTVDKLWDLSSNGTVVTNELAVHVQRFVALAFYACMPPSRSKEVRLLLDRVLTEKESKESRQNHITMLHGRYIAVISDFKNNKAWGRDAIELPADQQVLLKHLLWLMTPPVRQQLARAEMHGFLFCKLSGEAFVHASNWTSYLSRIVEDHTGLAIGPTGLRHAFATYLETSTDEDHNRLRDSVASSMRHTQRMQQSVYNDTSSLERKRRGVEFACNAFKRAVIGIDSSDKADMLMALCPPMGTIVGIRERDGAAAWAKVLRVESGTALVMVLRRTSPSGELFTPDASRVLRKNIATEIEWPIEYEMSGSDYRVTARPANIAESTL